jgi:hypothetical protein
MHHQNHRQLNSFQQLAKERLTNEIEIYYEMSVHKKFLADMYAVIPKGRKCVIWFTHKQCWMFQIAKRPYTPGMPGSGLIRVECDDVRMINVPFANDAWYVGSGTILYGTCISEKRNDVQRRFSVENIYSLCGEKQPNNGTLTRFSAFFDAYSKEQQQNPGANHHFQFYMPIMHANFNDAVRDALIVKTYDVFCIQHRFLNRASIEFKNLCMNFIEPESDNPQPKSLSFFPKQSNVVMAPCVPVPVPAPAPTTTTTTTTTVQKFTQTRTFIIRPDAQNDVYYVLRSLDEPITANTMIAHIPNYKTSVMMNGLFRNIKENRNLDSLEESDDEDEEFVPLVDLNKCVRMACTFNSRFKRWQPVDLQPL